MSERKQIERIAAALDRARRDERAVTGGAPFIGLLSLYCDWSACPVREVEVAVKEFHGERSTSSALRCPDCGEVLKIHGARGRSSLLEGVS